MPEFEQQLILFTLIFMRMTGFIVLNPLFGRKGIPPYFQVGLAFFLALLLNGFYEGTAVEISNSFQYGLLLLKEFAVGYVIAFVMGLFFLTVTYGGAIIDFQMGLSMSTVFDPQSNAQTAISGSIWNSYMTLLFFAVDGHLALIRILISSFQAAPAGMVTFGPDLLQKILDIFSQCLMLALQFSFPLIALELLTQFAVGIMMKTIPQINIFVINIQAKVIIGLGMLLFLFSPMSEFVDKLINNMLRAMQMIAGLL